MPVEVTMTCTDHLGKQRATRTVRGQTFQATSADRLAVHDEWNKAFAEPDGAAPYVFTTTRTIV